MNEDKLYLSDAIDYNRDIKGNRFVQIFSGVGSGKNTFVEQFIKGNEEMEIPQKTVLIITSRKSKVQETLSDDDLDITGKIKAKWDSYHFVMTNDDDIPEDIDDIDPMFIRTLSDSWGESKVYQKSVICTNAFIESYLKYVYVSDDVTTHLWELFDIIVIDEYHSIVLDASYQSAPFYIKELIEEFKLRHELADKGEGMRPLCEQIIMMTGTPEPIEMVEMPEEYTKVIDMRGICKNVQPEQICFIERKEAKKQIAEQIKYGYRAVYFENHTDLPKKFCNNTDIKPEDVAVSFSKQEKRAKLKKNDEYTYNRMVDVEKSITNTGLIPHDVKLFLTTGKNKEGINIRNEDVQFMYVESHIFSDIAQMAGRVREGINNLYVIVDAEPFENDESKYEELFSAEKIAMQHDNQVLGAANEYFEALCKRLGLDELYLKRETISTVMSQMELKEYVDFIHEKFPYIRYSYFDNYFKFYELRSKGKKYQEKSISEFADIMMNKEKCVEVFKKWFPDSEIEPYENNDFRAKLIFEKYIPDINVEYSEEVVNAMIAELQAQCYPKLKKLQAMLNRCTDNLKWSRRHNNKGRAGYDRISFVKDEKKSKKSKK